MVRGWMSWRNDALRKGNPSLATKVTKRCTHLGKVSKRRGGMKLGRY